MAGCKEQEERRVMREKGGVKERMRGVGGSGGEKRDRGAGGERS